MNEVSFIVGVIVGAIIAGIGGSMAIVGTNNGWTKQAIEHGCAGYDRTTGKFIWNMEKPHVDN